MIVQPGVDEDVQLLDEALYDGWEPYAVTWNSGAYSYTHHLRRATNRKPA